MSSSSASGIPAMGMSLLCIVGGAIGFFRKGSIPSFVAGLAVGMLYLRSGSQMLDAPAAGNVGVQGALLASVLLTLSSVPRLTKGPIPKVLALGSSIVGAYYARWYFNV